MFLISRFVPSAPPYPWAEPDKSQSDRYPGVLAAASSQTQPRTCVCIPAVLPHGYRRAGDLRRAARPGWELHPVPSAGSAARHHLSDPHVRVNSSGLEPTVRLELPSHAQNIQRHRWEQKPPYFGLWPAVTTPAMCVTIQKTLAALLQAGSEFHTVNFCTTLIFLSRNWVLFTAAFRNELCKAAEVVSSDRDRCLWLSHWLCSGNPFVTRWPLTPAVS